MFGLFLLPVAMATLVLIGHVKADAVPAPELASVVATGSAVGVASAGRSGGTATRPAREIMLEEDEDVLNQELSLEDLPDIGPGGRRRVILVGCALVLWVLLSWIGHLGTIGLLLPCARQPVTWPGRRRARSTVCRPSGCCCARWDSPSSCWLTCSISRTFSVGRSTRQVIAQGTFIG